MIEGLVESFAALDDPRCPGKVEHLGRSCASPVLVDVLVIAVCALGIGLRDGSLRDGRRGRDVRGHRPLRPLQRGVAAGLLGIARHLLPAGQAARREIALAAKGLEIAHLQFAFRGLTLAVCSRVRRDGAVEIELGLGDPHLPASTFTDKQFRDAEAAARARSQPARGKRRMGPR